MAEKLSQQEVDDFLAAYGFDKDANPACADHIAALVAVDNDLELVDLLTAINEARADGQPALPTIGLAAFRHEVEQYRAAQAPPPVAPAATPPAGPAAGPHGPMVPGTPVAGPPVHRPSRIGKFIAVTVATGLVLGLIILVVLNFHDLWGPSAEEVTKYFDDNETTPTATPTVQTSHLTRTFTCEYYFGELQNCREAPTTCSVKHTKRLPSHLVYQCPQGSWASEVPMINYAERAQKSGGIVAVSFLWVPVEN